MEEASEGSQWKQGRPHRELWFVIELGDLQAFDVMERWWKMSVVVSVFGRFLSRGKSLIDGADLQANNAVVASIEDSLLFAGSSGVDTLECQCKSSN